MWNCYNYSHKSKSIKLVIKLILKLIYSQNPVHPLVPEIINSPDIHLQFSSSIKSIISWIIGVNICANMRTSRVINREVGSNGVELISQQVPPRWPIFSISISFRVQEHESWWEWARFSTIGVLWQGSQICFFLWYSCFMLEWVSPLPRQAGLVAVGLNTWSSMQRSLLLSLEGSETVLRCSG